MNIVCSDSKASCGFTCTGKNYAATWEKLEPKFVEIFEIIDNDVDCGTCHTDGTKNLSGFRDFIKLGIGGIPFDVKNFIEFVNRINCVSDAAKKDGRI